MLCPFRGGQWKSATGRQARRGSEFNKHRVYAYTLQASSWLTMAWHGVDATILTEVVRGDPCKCVGQSVAGDWYTCTAAWVRRLRVWLSHMGLLPDTQNCVLRMRRECRERFPRHRLQRKSLISDPDMHHGTCVTHVPWCNVGIANQRWQGKRSRRMRNTQFLVSGKRPMATHFQTAYGLYTSPFARADLK